MSGHLLGRRAALLAVLAAIGGVETAVAVTHADCRIHGVRPYAHRHIDPGDQVVTCERPAITGRFSTSARCVAQGLIGDRVQPGTIVSSELPLAPDDPARIRAARLEQACAEALAGCEQAAYGLDQRIVCRVMDRSFAR